MLITDYDQAIDLSHGFDHGNYAHAYETQDLETMLADIEHRSVAYRAAAVMGFFASYALAEISMTDRVAYDEVYWSEYGQAVIAAGYCDARDAEYDKTVTEATTTDAGAPP